MDFPFAREAIKQLFSKPSTAMYPAVPSPAAPNYRGRIVFHPDKCINCMMCERVCSGNAITHTVEKTPEGDDKVTRTFYLGSCTFCATCMDFCTHGAIEFTDDYHMIATKEEDLMVSGTFLKKAPVKRPPAPKPEEKPKEAAGESREAPAAQEKPVGQAEAAPAAEMPREASGGSGDKPVEKKAEAEQAASEEAPAIVPRDDGKPVQDASKCVYCTICAKKCPAGALEVDRANKTWTLDEDLCVGCGTCAEACPKKCIII